MRATAALLVMLALLLGAAASRAAQPQWPILDTGAVPYLKAQGRSSYAGFLLTNLPRAIAVAANGAYGWYGGGGSIEDVRAKALKSCADKGGIGCAIYAEDLQVVWQGRPAVALPPVPGPLIEARDYAFVPDPRYIWHGPQSALGLYVWAHGTGTAHDSRGAQPQPHVRAFNNAGFDIVRFDRAPTMDTADDAAEWLHTGLAALRARGWRTVVAAGQSRGAWNSLQALDTPGLADAVIAISPARFSSQTTQEADLSRILRRAAASPRARVAVAQFKGDIYVRDMPGRIDMLRDLLPSRVAAALVIDQPEGITGHGGGGSADFARRFGPCLLRFVTDPVPPKECTPPGGS
ncbi:MAG TPA: hypothetical protein VGI78_13720 [Acetobacteraceae bacterium]|jgi:hypothetical protein